MKYLKESENLFKKSIEIKKQCLDEGIDVLDDMSSIITNSIVSGGKLMICGNGGSAADAQHLAAEMLIRLRPENNRDGIPAIALAQDTSTITACGNDFGFNFLYQRVIESIGKEGDCLIGISTSGNSKNIILAMKAAKKLKINAFAFLGSNGGEVLKYCDLAFVVPSNITGRIQEIHITAGHALMENIENRLIDKEFIKLKKST